MSAALPYRWTGEAFEPLPAFRKAADREYVVGAVYRLEEVQERSMKSHGHEFAFLGEAWRNLPEALADQFPSPEHLRKAALVETGWYDETVVDVGSKAGALRVAAYARSKSEFAAVVTRGPIVVIREAKSQSRRAMTPADFQKSKSDVLDWVARLIGVPAETLQREAGRAA